MINFVCVFYGTKYSPDYLQNLYNMVKRHLTVDHKFICFTDQKKLPEQVKGDIEYRNFTARKDLNGWWNKLQLFTKEANLIGVNLYMDLDVVILDNIDCMAKFGHGNTFGVINDFNRTTKLFNSSVLKFNNDIATKAIWQPFLDDEVNMKRNQGDQNVISHFAKRAGIAEVMPDEWTFSAKWHNRDKPRFGKQLWTFEIPKGAKVAVFHGKPNPHESDVDWVKENWK